MRDDLLFVVQDMNLFFRGLSQRLTLLELADLSLFREERCERVVHSFNSGDAFYGRPPLDYGVLRTS